MVFWYNNTPNFADIIPAAAIYAYHPRLPKELKKKNQKEVFLLKRQRPIPTK